MSVMGNLWAVVVWRRYGHAEAGRFGYAANAVLDGMDMLFRNLAVAGALTEARNRGYDEGESAGFDFGYADACNGRAGC